MVPRIQGPALPPGGLPPPIGATPENKGPGRTKGISTPFPPRKLKELMAGATVNVYVGAKPNHDLVFAMPKGLICHFSPSIRQKLVMGQEKVIILERSDKSSVSWVLRWMLAGGIEKTSTPAEVLEDDAANMDLLLHRLQVVDQLRIGQLCETISKEVLNQFTITAVTTEQLGWAYSHNLDFIPNGLRATMVEGVLDSVLDLDLVYPIDIFTNKPLLYHDMVVKVDTLETVKRIGASQRNWPLSVDQIRFLYEFSALHGHVRKTIAHGLLKLMDANKVPDEQAYRDLAWEINDFDDDMNKAIETKKRAEDHAQYLERKARRKAKAAAAKHAAENMDTKVKPRPSQQVAVAGRGTRVATGKGSKGLKASGPTKVEATPVKPAKRLESSVVLRLDTTGAVTKER